MDSDAASRGTLWGLATLASFCCVGSGTVAIAGGTAVAGGAVGGLSSGVVQLLVSIVTLGLVAGVLRLRSGCSNCEA